MARSGTNRQYSFANIPSANIQRSTFDRSHGLKTTFDPGVLIPIFWDEALPGDTFNLRLNSFGRLATLLHPVMENIYLDYHFFAVPNRLLWTNWKKFMGEQANPGDSISFNVPVVTAPVTTGWVSKGIGDHFGLPLGSTVLNSSALYLRAYQLIWNEWYRDENLQNSLVVALGDGPDTGANYTILPRGKRHDYFTACLPFVQKGTAPTFGLGALATVIPSGDGEPVFQRPGLTSNTKLEFQTAAPAHIGIETAGTWANLENLRWQDPKLTADLSTATALTVNALRDVVTIQQFLEKDARGGTRYTEIVRSHFGVVSPDARQQRPEFLGGGTTRINVNPIAATNISAGVVEIGDLGAFGTSAGNGIGFVKSFTEHCVIIGLVSARADLNYQQGLERQMWRRTRYDFYWPVYANIGEQAVYNREIFYTNAEAPDGATNKAVFGYQERWAEYRYKPSRVTGLFRSDCTAGETSIHQWHLAQDFAALPVLNASFIVENPDIDRIIAVNTEPAFLLDCWFEFKATRPLPVFSVPGLRRL